MPGNIPDNLVFIFCKFSDTIKVYSLQDGPFETECLLDRSTLSSNETLVVSWYVDETLVYTSHDKGTVIL